MVDGWARAQQRERGQQAEVLGKGAQQSEQGQQAEVLGKGASRASEASRPKSWARVRAQSEKLGGCEQEQD